MIGDLLGMAAGGSLGSLFVKLTADSSQLVKGMHEAELAVGGGSARMLASVKLLSLGATGALVAMGAVALREFSKFEDSFTGVRKTVDATGAEFAKLSTTLREMSKNIPVNVNEINSVAEAAGQLGIKVEDMEKFTRTMVDLGVATNLSSQQAASDLAGLATITEMSAKDFDRLGSALVALGNKFNGTEQDITSMALRIAGAGSMLKLTQAEILGVATALSSVKINAEQGGSAISFVMREMAKSVATGNEKLADFAEVAGVSAERFQASFKKDVVGTLALFLTGLKQSNDAGQEIFSVLDRLGLDGRNVADVLTRAAGASGLFTRATAEGTKAWKENTALAKEAEIRYKTVSSQLIITWNNFKDLLITVGEGLAPALLAVNDMLKETAKSLAAAEKESGSVTAAFTSLVEAAKYLGQALAVIWFGLKSISTLIVHELLSAVDKLKVALSAASAGPRVAFALLHGDILGANIALKDMAGQVQGPLNNIAGSVAETAEELAAHWNKLLDTHIKLFVPVVKGAADAKKGLEKVTDTVDGFKKAMDDAAAATDAAAAKAKRASQAFMDVMKLMGHAESPLEKMGLAGKDEQALLKKLGVDQKLIDKMMQPKMKVGLGMGSEFDAGTTAIKEEQKDIESRLEMLKAMGDKEIAQFTGIQKSKEEILKAYTDRLIQLQLKQASVALQAGQSIFESMSSMAKDLGGEQSAMYKVMFAASKAFAIADATVKIAQGIAGAFSLPWPSNLVAAASVMAATASIVSSIKSVELVFAGPKAMGGPVAPGSTYLVGEKGPELFAPAVLGSIIPNGQLGGQPVRVVINNYTDAQSRVTEKQDGREKVIEVVIRRVKTEIGGDIRDGVGSVSQAMEKSFGLKRGRA